jgi:hypothetical protein
MARQLAEVKHGILSCPCAADAKYVYMPRRDIKDSGDFPCGYRDPEDGGAEQPFCFIPGDLNTVARTCDDDSSCVAFVWGKRADVAGGYLKTRRGPLRPFEHTSVYLWLKAPGAHTCVAQRASYLLLPANIVIWHVFGKDEPPMLLLLRTVRCSCR